LLPAAIRIPAPPIGSAALIRHAFFAPSPGSIGLESGINDLLSAVVNFDMALQKEFVMKDRLHFQFRIDAFNVFNHTDFSGYNGTLNFNSYPTNGNGIVTGLPTIAATALGRNANGPFNDRIRHRDPDPRIL
jgi:hypothetical protein